MSTFLNIPHEEIKSFLLLYGLKTSRDPQEDYLQVWNYILDHPNLYVPPGSIKDFILAYNHQGDLTARHTTSSILLASNQEFSILTRSLGLPGLDKEQLIRILSYLNLLDNDKSVFDALPKETLKAIGMKLDCQSLGTFCRFSSKFNDLFCVTAPKGALSSEISEDRSELTEMLRAKLQETTRLDLSQFTREELGHQCLMNKMKGKIFPGGIRSLVLDSRGRVERFELVRNEGYSLELLKTSKVGQVVAISDSEQTLLLNSQGQVFAFGDNASGQAGLGEQEYIEVPTLIKKPDLGKIIAVSAGGMHSLFLNSQGQVFSCGYGDHGELGLGDFDFRNIPTLIEDTGFGKITAISAGYDYSLILNSQGQVYAFGRNNLGQLGLGDDEAREVPTLVETPGFENIVAIAAGQSYSLALDSQGQVFTFGHEDFAFLPPEAYETLFIPKLVESQIMGKIVAISIGSGYSLLLNSRGQVYSLNVISVSREAHGGRYTVTLVNSPWNQHIVATSVAYDHSLFLNSQGQIFLIKDEEPGYIDFENLSEEKSLVLVKEITL